MQTLNLLKHCRYLTKTWVEITILKTKGKFHQKKTPFQHSLTVRNHKLKFRLIQLGL